MATIGPWVKIKAHLDNIALSHAVFALPFAYMGSFLAVQGWPRLDDLGWITVSMLSARSLALALNNLIDLKYDRLHPRFTQRPLVAGIISPGEAVAVILLSLSIFAWAAVNLHPLCIKLLPLALVPMTIYPYMKRFSWICHFVLGIALSLAPIGSWVAIRGDIALPAVLLGLAVGLWIAAFDVIYACQDVDFDKEHGLHSMPVRFGITRAMQVARTTHVTAVGLLWSVGVLCGLNGSYYLGVIIAAAVLFYQHMIVSPGDLSRVSQAYFMRNGLVSIAICVFTLLSLL